jgi:hypothetical protein
MDFARRDAAGLRELVMFRLETVEGNWLPLTSRATGQAVTVVFVANSGSRCRRTVSAEFIPSWDKLYLSCDFVKSVVEQFREMSG